LDRNGVQECRTELEAFKKAVGERSQAILDRGTMEVRTGPAELPPMDGQEGTAAGFGIDLILEVCKTSIPELPQQEQEVIERIVGSTSELCTYQILSELDRVRK